MLERQVDINFRGQRSRSGSGWRSATLRWHSAVALDRRAACSAAASLVVPTGPVVGLALFVEARIQTVFGQLESFLDQKRGVGIVDQVLLGDALAFESVTNQPAQDRDIPAGPNLPHQICPLCRASESGMHR